MPSLSRRIVTRQPKSTTQSPQRGHREHGKITKESSFEQILCDLQWSLCAPSVCFVFRFCSSTADSASTSRSSMLIGKRRNHPRQFHISALCSTDTH